MQPRPEVSLESVCVKCQGVVLCVKTVRCISLGPGELPPQAKEFKYLEVLFTEQDVDRQFWAALVLIQTLYQTNVVKKELSRKVKLLDTCNR